MAMYQADIAVRDILGQGGPGADYRALPRVTFTDPEIGAVGLTEQQARDAGLDVQVGHSPPAVLDPRLHPRAGQRGLHQAGRGPRRGVLVGATSAGPAGGEVLGALAVAVHAEVPVPTLLSTI